MVGAMDLLVAIRAGADEDSVAYAYTGDSVLVVQGSRMARVAVAALAEEGLLGLEHPEVVGPVGFVAGQAVFPGREMFPEHGSALLGVALIALVIDRCRVDEIGVLGPVGIVAA